MILVDELTVWPHARHECFRRGSAHLTTTGSIEELHAFAARIGLRRSWFQPRSVPHYDLSPGKREQALRAGAEFVPAREQARARIAARAIIGPMEDKPKKKLRKRSEARAEKPSAAERTVPIPGTEEKGLPGHAQCRECGETVAAAKCTRRPSGELECSECGAPIPEEGFTEELRAAAKADAPREISFKRPVFCDQCGAEWKIIDGKPWPNCGHKEGFVDDPKKAKRWNPPAGHPRPPPADVVEAQRAQLAPAEKPPLPAPRVTVTDVPEAEPGIPGEKPCRLGVEWGKVTINRGAYNTIGPFSVYVDCGRHEVLKVGVEMLDQLEKLADHAMAVQRKWYARKMKELEASEGG